MREICRLFDQTPSHPEQHKRSVAAGASACELDCNLIRVSRALDDEHFSEWLLFEFIFIGLYPHTRHQARGTACSLWDL